MKIIPVIDVLNGVVVNAVRGQRKEYQPLKSVLTDSVEPAEVAAAFKTLGFSELYLADLDAILGKKPNFQLYSKVSKQNGLKMVVDAGVSDIQTAENLLNNGVSKVIIGTETLQTINFIKQAIRQIGVDHIIVSLDMKGNQVLTKPGFDGSKDALKLLREFRAMGVSQFIVLDLARVGSGEGVDTAFLKEALSFQSGRVYVGGGVRNVGDLLELKSLGLSGVLLATALHTGRIDVADLKALGLL